MTLTDLTELAGIAAITLGVALFSLPAGFIAAGVLIVVWSVARALMGRDVKVRWRRSKPGGDRR